MFKIALVFILIAHLGCTKKDNAVAGEKTVAEMSEAELVERGKSTYMISCIACHNAEPSKDGSMGPAVQFSSLELLQLKVLKNQYPPRYAPKRTTAQMLALPHLEKEIPAIHAFLNKSE